MRLSLMSRTKRRFQRRNVSSQLDSAVVITLLIDAESTWCESSRMPSADGVVRTTNRQNIYGNDVRRSCWNYAIVTYLSDTIDEIFRLPGLLLRIIFRRLR